jgi:hypothetical protein
MDEKKHNIDPLEETDMKEEIPHELFAEKKDDLNALNKKVHDGGEAEIPPLQPEDFEDPTADD